MSTAAAIRTEQPSVHHAPADTAVGLTCARSWAELVYAVVDLAPAIAFFCTVITLFAVGLGLAVIYVGIPILVLALLVARFGGLVQRSLALVLLGLPAQAPEWPRPGRGGPVAAIGAVLRDPANWRAVGYLCIKIVLAPLTFSVAVAFYGYGLGALTYPIWRPYLPEQVAWDGSVHRGTQLWPNFFVDTWPGMVVLGLLGLGVLWCAPRVVTFLTTIDRMLIVSLLARRADG